MKTTQTQLQNQKGFTLVEIAIVLVIIGLLLGGVLKGQELIENTKIKAVKTGADALMSAVYGYQDRYNNLPGDDADLLAGATQAAGNEDGLITAAEAPWESLRLAGFLAGSGAAAPENPFGGTTTLLSVTNGIQICQGGLTQEQKQLVDTKYDDGDGTTGVIVEGGAAPSATYATAASTICITY
ncbi:prepilin-type N-terminal cleavage/methylation domain-containing protein [Thiomicrorhabdus sp. ZW0627]|uniref:prepilin-type N-terminal cleavage/methylation domain-containing protein n=1 Tax=Thiomicrorhabdus sp. ZW0627 TaxID=3039774 RepID=UPI002436A2B9|nr:prepilin-type N-terminal cleavage/methylation domain-containing protein [Thiomicrorhabdus sp. ZW0627]MDG6774772.1 prepilin-type N-terminal cleavage/methylation domain-containing protein [Thiomicrorhabdus sp. ZW0627]